MPCTQKGVIHMKQLMKRLSLLLMSLFLLLSGCKSEIGQESRCIDIADAATMQSQSDIAPQPAVSDEELLPQWEIPPYTSEPYTEINGNIPFFIDDEITDQSFETYSPLDTLGRCGTAFACVGQDLTPTEERGSIGQVKPSGWHLVKYDCVDGQYLYNRCHLIQIPVDR